MPGLRTFALVGLLAVVLARRRNNRREIQQVVSPLHQRAIRFFGGRVVNPLRYRRTVSDLGRFLRASGVRYYDAVSLVSSKRDDRALRMGLCYSDRCPQLPLLPPRRWWPRAVPILLFADGVTRATNDVATLNYWWRPDSAPESDRYPRPGGGFNAQIEGAEQGDHPQAYAIDLDWDTREGRDEALRRLEQLYDEQRWLEVSYGVGNTLTHVGMGSPAGRRRWTY